MMSAASHVRLASMVLVLTGLSGCLMSETESTLGPDQRVAQLTLVPMLSGPAAVGVADVRSLRITVTRADLTVALDSTVAVTENVVVLAASVTYTPPSEVLSVEVSLLNESDERVFSGGPLEVTVGDGEGEGEPIGVPMIYVGLGSDAVSVSVDPPLDTVVVGGSSTLTGRTFRSDGTETSGTPIKWTSLDPSIAAVPDEGSGLVRALQPGMARITATAVPLASGEPADTALIVVLLPQVVTVNVSSPIGRLIAVGRDVQLDAAALDADDNVVPDVTLTWTSSDEGAINVTVTGLATAIARGAASITVEAGGRTGSIDLTAVDADLDAVSFLVSDPYSASLIAGLDAATMTAVSERLSDCVGHVSSGALESLRGCAMGLLAEPGAGTADDIVLLAVLALIWEQVLLLVPLT